MHSTYPLTSAGRDKWILSKRVARERLDAQRPRSFFVEEECSHTGDVVDVATVFLTNRECPWRCVMCDLWKDTLTEQVAGGAIPAQIDAALRELPSARQIKLYNSGSFFDPRAIPLVDYCPIAERLGAFERVIVECHPALVGKNCLRFRDLLPCRLEVAMGLETSHPETLARLNKQMTLEQFRTAASFLRAHDIDLRVFILVQPPFQRLEDALYWAERSLDFAFDCGATAATLIPTRATNGAMETLESQGEFVPCNLETLEAAACYGLSLRRGRVFSDLWNIDSFPSCECCRQARVFRLREMNRSQRWVAPALCRSRATQT